MSVDVILPKWELTMEGGTVAAWYVDEGDHVVEGEVIVEVENEKVENELEAPCAGVMAQILVDEDETVDVGTVLAVIAENEAESATIGDWAPEGRFRLIRRPAGWQSPVPVSASSCRRHPTRGGRPHRRTRG